jgi:hypothetical protein
VSSLVGAGVSMREMPRTDGARQRDCVRMIYGTGSRRQTTTHDVAYSVPDRFGILRANLPKSINELMPIRLTQQPLHVCARG